MSMNMEQKILDAMLQKAIENKQKVNIRITDKNTELDCLMSVVLSKAAFNSETGSNHVSIEDKDGLSLGFFFDTVSRNDNAECKFYIESDTVIITVIIKK